MNQNPYKVSILVPVYGVEKYIERCVHSLFEQTYENIEYIFVDDCSPDRSIAVLQKVLKDYPYRKKQVKIIHHEKNHGTATAKNNAIAAMTGKFLTHVDSDDWIEKDAIEKLVKKQIETNADIVTGLMYINDDTMEDCYIEPVYKGKNEMMINILSQDWHHELCGRLIRSSLYKENHLKFLDGVNHSEDWRMMVMLLWHANKIARLDEVVYHYVMSDDSLCRSEKTWEQFKSSRYEDYKNFSSLIDFFMGKNESYYKLAIEKSAQKASDIMFLALDHHDNKLFYCFRKEIVSRYSNVMIPMLGPKISYLLRLPFSYYILSCYLKIAGNK